MNKVNCDKNYSPIGTKFMVASPHHFATQVGADILKLGGSAVDSAIATNAVLCVVYPHMCGLGGDLFAQVWDPSSKQVIGLNASGKSGERARRELFLSEGKNEINPRGPLSALTVPGVVDGWSQLHKRYGKLSWEVILEPAIKFTQGFPISRKLSDSISDNFAYLKLSSDGYKTFTRNSKPLREGDILVQKDLGKSLALISKEGPNVFYKNILSDLLIAGLGKLGGILTKADFSLHKSDWVTPIRTTYQDYTVTELPPNSQGVIFLMMLNILEHVDWSSIPRLSAQYFHILVESFKKVIPDLEQWVTDPETLLIPVDSLLSKQYGMDKYREIQSSQFSKKDSPSNRPTDGDTVYLSTVDSDGMVVSLMQSVFREFGSGIMPDGTGIFLQNRGSAFSLSNSHPNNLLPRKRTSHTLMPAIALKDGKPILVFGTMGGEAQAQTLATIFTNFIDYKLGLQEAISSPRFFYGRMPGDVERLLYIEARVPTSVSEDLSRFGHTIKIASNFSKYMGHAQGIFIDSAKGLLSGAADPRADGSACGC